MLDVHDIFLYRGRNSGTNAFFVVGLVSQRNFLLMLEMGLLGTIYLTALAVSAASFYTVSRCQSRVTIPAADVTRSRGSFTIGMIICRDSLTAIDQQSIC